MYIYIYTKIIYIYIYIYIYIPKLYIYIYIPLPVITNNLKKHYLSYLVSIPVIIPHAFKAILSLPWHIHFSNCFV